MFLNIINFKLTKIIIKIQRLNETERRADNIFDDELVF